MKCYSVDVTYNAKIIETMSVYADSIEEAEQKIRNGGCDDVYDSYTELEEIIDFDFFEENVLDEDGNTISTRGL